MRIDSNNPRHQGVSAGRRQSLVSILLLLLVATPLAAEHRRELSATAAADSGATVVLENLAGSIRIERGGDQVSIDAEVVGEDAEMSGLIKLKVDRRGGETLIHLDYPVDRYDTYYYPDGQSAGSWGWWGGSEQRYQGRRLRVTSKQGRGAVTLYVNIVMRLPDGVGAKVENVAGAIQALGIHGDLMLDTASGQVHAGDCEGSLSADTGSGNVEIENHRGTVVADTGSGDVEINGVVGDVTADTGSGDIRLRDIQADKISADTGSGDVELEDVSGQLALDTGSGDIDGRGVVARGRLVADTGSGHVILAGDLSALDRLVIDTGSGKVILRSSPFPEVDLTVNTGSGRILVDIGGLRIDKKEDDYLEATLGSGRVRAEIDTGSGSVTLSEDL